VIVASNNAAFERGNIMDKETHTQYAKRMAKKTNTRVIVTHDKDTGATCRAMLDCPMNRRLAEKLGELIVSHHPDGKTS
jgi:hypothetical protein